jgi:putative nucleotidyltransferase with HDIG domain
MVDYGSLARTRPPADEVRKRVLRQIARGRAPYDGRLPCEAELNALLDEWLPPGTIQAGVRADGCTWDDLTRHRKTSDYWRDHCWTVAEMMARLAKALSQDDRLWRTAGLVHDLDFLAGPHFNDTIDPEKAHPTAIAVELLEMGLPLVVVLAILEHSPHLNLPSTSPLSHALILCDEHATMTSAGETPDYGPEAPASILACLVNGKPIKGYTRDDMQARASQALVPLSALHACRDRAGLTYAFKSEGWTI